MPIFEVKVRPKRTKVELFDPVTLTFIFDSSDPGQKKEDLTPYAAIARNHSNRLFEKLLVAVSEVFENPKRIVL